MSSACIGWSIVSRLTPACQYGSRPEVAIIVDRHVAPMETSSPLGVVSTLWQATQFSDGVNSDSGCGFAATGRVCCAPGAALKNAISQIAETNRSEEHTSELQSRLHLVCR